MRCAFAAATVVLAWAAFATVFVAFATFSALSTFAALFVTGLVGGLGVRVSGRAVAIAAFVAVTTVVA